MIDKCLFPAAGYGTRFLPATKAMPKEMLPILVKPLIQYGVEEALEAGCHTMAIVTGRGKRAIEDHFDRNYELEHQIEGTDKEELLKDTSFVRISKTTIVNIDYLKFVRPLLGGKMEITFINDESLVVNRHYLKSFKNKFGL